MNTKRKSLGSGLDVLLGHMLDAPPTESSPLDWNDAPLTGVTDMPIQAIAPNPFQPRQDFDPDDLAQLSLSIRAQGVIQPLVVRPLPDGQYQLVAGERRLRAAQMAQLTEVPVVIRAMDDTSSLMVAMVENLQRVDLNPCEKARGLQRLVSTFHLTHQAVADAVGYSRAQITNLLRLLTLSKTIQSYLEAGHMNMGHARALLSLPVSQRDALAARIVAQRWSVRDTEQAVARCLQDEPQPRSSTPPPMVHLAQQFSQALGLPVHVHQRANGSGKLILNYQHVAELEQLLQQLQS